VIREEVREMGGDNLVNRCPRQRQIRWRGCTLLPIHLICTHTSMWMKETLHYVLVGLVDVSDILCLHIEQLTVCLSDHHGLPGGFNHNILSEGVSTLQLANESGLVLIARVHIHHVQSA
jgi:hypothetical protein